MCGAVASCDDDDDIYLFERDRIARSHAIGQLGGLGLPNLLQELDEVRDALHVAH
eukprot:COSAG01_NODE_31439_length_597_cov_4.905622_2_plen_55_part_00